MKIYSEARDEASAGAWDRAAMLFDKLEGRAAGTPLAQQAQIEKIKVLKANRDQALAVKCLAAITEAVNSGQNIMPPVIAAVEANCTLGEISDTLRNLFGEYQA